jgi:hypothetical protein
MGVPRERSERTQEMAAGIIPREGGQADRETKGGAT